MKILNISFHNNFNLVKNFENKKTTGQNENFSYSISPLEYLDRSQVAFCGDTIKLNADDKRFIDVVSRDLRFSDKQKEKFTDVVQDYLKENNLKSLNEIDSEDSNEQSYFLDKINKNLDLSDSEFDVLAIHTMERICCEDIYLPEDRRFIKDLSIIEPILEKYGLDKDAVDTVSDAMLIDADIFECETLFDIFNIHTKSLKNTLFYNILSNVLDEDKCINVVIDLCLQSKQYEKEGEKLFPRNIERTTFYNSLDDEFITDDILEEFKIDETERENISKYVAKRHNNISLEQIGFEIAEEYNLPAKSDKKIIEIIKNQQDLNNKLKIFEE